jgi:hypothetical protein
VRSGGSLGEGSRAAARDRSYLSQLRSEKVKHLRLDRVLEVLAAVDEDPGQFFRSCWPESRGNLPPEKVRRTVKDVKVVAAEKKAVSKPKDSEGQEEEETK